MQVFQFNSIVLKQNQQKYIFIRSSRAKRKEKKPITGRNKEKKRRDE